MSDEKEQPSNVVPLRVLEGGVSKGRALSKEHRDHLYTSGLSDESIAMNGFWTSMSGTEIAKHLGRPWRARGGAIMIPFVLPGSGAEYFCRARPDAPRLSKKDGKPIKYEQPEPDGVFSFVPYFPARSRTQGWLTDVSRDLLFVEGEKKAALLDQMGYATVGSTGVDCFHDKPYREATGLLRLHEMILKHVAIAGRRCVIVFDSDYATNENVVLAARKLTAMCKAAGATDVLLARIPQEGTKKYGIDDYFVSFGEAATRTVLTENHERVEPVSNDESAFTVAKHKALQGIPVHESIRIPRGYSIDKSGRLTEFGDDDAEVIERSGIFIRRVVSDLYSGAENVELVFRRAGAWRTVCVPRRSIVDSRQLVAEMGPVGGPVDSNTASKVVTWLRDYEAENEKRLPHATSVGRCGWHRVGPRDVFLLGEQIIAAEGHSVDLVVERGSERARLWRALRATGDYDAHLEALRAAWNASAECALVICGALAAPLLRPLGSPLFGLHLAGDSSRGKSSMLKVAASVYGDVRDEEWVTSWNSTSVGHEVRASLLCDLPLCIDEAGVVDARERERAVYMLINGVGRVRGAREGGLREGHSWRTVVLSTGEQRLAGEETATGAQVRIIQRHIGGFGSLDAAGVDAVRRACEEHAGHVGAEWIASLVATTEAEWSDHRTRLKERSRSFQAHAKGGTVRARQAGFWAFLAHVEAIAFDVLGLGREGGATMRHLFSSGGDAQVEVRTASERAIDSLREWISSAPASFPVVEMTSSGSRDVKRSAEHLREVCGYIDEGRLLVLPIALRKHLEQAGISDQVALREWRAREWIDADKDYLTTTVRVGGKKVRVVSIRGDLVGLDQPNTDFGGDHAA